MPCSVHVHAWLQGLCLVPSCMDGMPRHAAGALDVIAKIAWVCIALKAAAERDIAWSLHAWKGLARLLLPGWKAPVCVGALKAGKVSWGMHAAFVCVSGCKTYFYLGWSSRC